jgi:hypothetical protein
MSLKPERSILIFLALCIVPVLRLRFQLAATPILGKENPKAIEITQPFEPTKKVEEFVLKGLEYSYEFINNSEFGCHENKINKTKFTQSVHGANFCNSCYLNITHHIP